MSMRKLLARGWQLGRLALPHVTPAVRVGPSAPVLRPRVRQPLQCVLPARYRFFRHSVGSLAAQLQRQAFGRGRGTLLAFGLGLGFVEQQAEEIRAYTTVCDQLQTQFKRKKTKYENSVPLPTIGHCLEDYKIGDPLGKGCNAAVYKAFISEGANPKSSSKIMTKERQPESKNEEKKAAVVPDISSICSEIINNSTISQESSSLSFVVLERDPPSGPVEDTSLPEAGPLGDTSHPLALKMLWNLNTESSSDAILRTMGKELVPTIPNALSGEFNKAKGLVLSSYYNMRKLKPHPNIIQIVRAFTAEFPLLTGAWEEYPDVLPKSLNPNGFGCSHTLFLVMKSYPCTLKQYLEVCSPWSGYAVQMILQLLEGVDHLVQNGIAHRDLKADNILVEFDSVGWPRLVITDFGCCLANCDRGLKLPFTSMEVDRGGNTCLMAPEICTAVPGPRASIDYSKSDAWTVGTLAYEILGLPNPFYPRGMNYLESRNYEENKLPPLPNYIHRNVRQVVKLLLCRDPKKRLSARIAANMLHLQLWNSELLALAEITAEELFDWLCYQFLPTCLQFTVSCESTVQTELKRNFLANLSFEDLNLTLDLLLAGEKQLKFTNNPVGSKTELGGNKCY
ncbi:serine/threonine-protein kinase PINK1, mitochondrial [Hypanus sabinus]|uniref:serine/threonine-protein kinase PINK1, mitochondrial n=1 Tax=Hypanus sabinus TaxID=79690 RepID=UPI0028C3B2A5|nr:serine/threonine-protein kinase PINK1, mitochondrial [Hypanus sabinus]